MSKRNRPPKRLSDLVELAVNDARRLDRSVYEPRAAVWHTPDVEDPTKCKVCLAGAVIAGTLHRLPSERFDFNQISDAWAKALDVLDLVRDGSYDGAWLDHVMRPGKDLTKTGRSIRQSIPDARHQYFTTWEGFDLFLADLEQEVIPALPAYRGRGVRVTGCSQWESACFGNRRPAVRSRLLRP